MLRPCPADTTDTLRGPRSFSATSRHLAPDSRVDAPAAPLRPVTRPFVASMTMINIALGNPLYLHASQPGI